MSGKTVTDKRIDAERKKANAVCEKLYEQAFPTGMSPMPWLEMLFVEDELAIALKPRPMSTMDVRIAFNAYIVAFKAACKKYGQQA